MLHPTDDFVVAARYFAPFQIDQTDTAISGEPCSCLQPIQSTQAFTLQKVFQAVSASFLRDLGCSYGLIVEELEIVLFE